MAGTADFGGPNSGSYTLRHSGSNGPRTSSANSAGIVVEWLGLLKLNTYRRADCRHGRDRRLAGSVHALGGRDSSSPFLVR